MTTQAEFFQTNAVDGVLPDQLMAEFLSLPEGDISLVVDVHAPTAQGGATPGAADLDDQGGTAAPTPAPAAPAPAPAPAAPTPQVVLARDGVHTIPFERLEEARNTAAQEKARADALAAEVERLRLAGAAPSPAQAPAPAPAAAPAAQELEAGLFGDYSDAALAAGIEKLVSQRTAGLQQQLATLQGQLAPVQEQATINANEAHWRQIYTAHPDTDSMVDSVELQAWMGTQPSFVRQQYQAVLDEGTAGQVVELFDAFKQATGRTSPPPPTPSSGTAAAAAAQAAAAIAAARQPAPTSLSEIPAGTSAHHDEAAAMLELTPTAVMQRLERLSPQEIEARLSRIL